MRTIFVPHTERSELAKRWREKLEAFENLGTMKLKVIELAGNKFVDII